LTDRDESALADLLVRLEGLSGPDRAVDRQIMSLFYRWEQRWTGGIDEFGDHYLDWVWVEPDTDQWRTTARDGFEFTASLDAAVELVDRVLPRWEGSLSIAAGRDSWVRLWTDNGMTEYASDAPTAPLALLRALVAAKMAEASIPSSAAGADRT
jgi:hypothetical protein